MNYAGDVSMKTQEAGNMEEALTKNSSDIYSPTSNSVAKEVYYIFKARLCTIIRGYGFESGKYVKISFDNVGNIIATYYGTIHVDRMK
jgi:hypothetical protein